MIIKVPSKNPWEIMEREKDFLAWSVEEDHSEEDVTNKACLCVAKIFENKLFLQLRMSQCLEFANFIKIEIPQTVVRIKDRKMIFKSFCPTFDIIKKQVNQLSDRSIMPIGQNLFPEDSKQISLTFQKIKYTLSNNSSQKPTKANKVSKLFKNVSYNNPPLKEYMVKSRSDCIHLFPKSNPKTLSENSNKSVPKVRYDAKTETATIYNLNFSRNSLLDKSRNLKLKSSMLNILADTSQINSQNTNFIDLNGKDEYLHLQRSVQKPRLLGVSKNCGGSSLKLS